MPPRVVFLGKSKPSVGLAFRRLVDYGFDVAAVVAQPGSELESRARHAGIEVLRDVADVPPCEFLFSFLYWKRVPQDVLTRARLCLNFHPAPLPRYPGLWGVSRAILDHANTFGVTAHVMTEDFDRGMVFATHEVEIDPDCDTAASLDAKAQAALLTLFGDVIELLREDDQFGVYRETPPAPVPLVVPPSRAALEAMKRIEPDDAPWLIERKVRAFWNPPYSGAQVVIAGMPYTVAPRSVAGGA